MTQSTWKISSPAVMEHATEKWARIASDMPEQTKGDYTKVNLKEDEEALLCKLHYRGATQFEAMEDQYNTLGGQLGLLEGED
ncbi:hypothetical protein U1Q18_026471 [Sarracenia purpurea var. burkii]